VDSGVPTRDVVTDSAPTTVDYPIDRYVGPYFSTDGHVDLDVAQQAIDAVAAELAVAPVSASEVYSAPVRRNSRIEEATWSSSSP